MDPLNSEQSQYFAPGSLTPVPLTKGGTTVDHPATAESVVMPTRDSGDHLAAAALPADNSGRNLREDGHGLTPLDQGGSASDLSITAKLRSAITDHHDLSINAQNIKIITSDGVVTLRGVVTDERERAVILAIARDSARNQKIDDRLDLVR